MIKVGINGFGRIGRQIVSAMVEKDVLGKKVEVVAVVDVSTDADYFAYQLKYDSIHGRFKGEIHTEKSNPELKENDILVVNGNKIKCLMATKSPDELPWKELGVEYVFEATGLFSQDTQAQKHIDAGAKKVLLTAPGKGDGVKTIVMGVNENEYDDSKHHIISNASCTTNCLAPVVHVLLKEGLGIETGLMTTIHAYTATQNLTDSPVKGSDLRRGRAATYNIVPSTTGAALTVGKVIKDLKGKFDGISFRVPVICGSIADITMVTSKPTTVEEVNEILEKAANEPRWNKIMKVTKEQLVSSDIIGEEFGAIIDLNFTKVVDGDLVKVLSWYDNELGYARTLVEHARAIKAQL